jgi:hypothetical protein
LHVHTVLAYQHRAGMLMGRLPLIVGYFDSALALLWQIPLDRVIG